MNPWKQPEKIGISRPIWLHPREENVICILDQRALPHEVTVAELRTVDDVFHAIRDMLVRGAPLIGVTAAYGMVLAAAEAARQESFDAALSASAARIASARPTAVNLKWAVEEQMKTIAAAETVQDKVEAARKKAAKITEDDVEMCRRIGEYGLTVIREIYEKIQRPVNILTHCNAGWLACVEWGTATAPIYLAHRAGIPVHVWVDETRPRNQGASLTAWELGEGGVPYTLITDNAGGLLMRLGKVDMAIVGTDRTTRTGDVANKIGTYLKALAAKANNVPFYAAVPSPSIDWHLSSGMDIPIEERDAEEVKYVSGLCEEGIRRVLIAPEGARVSNFGFDVTPAELVTGLITERGIAQANETSLLGLFPEKKSPAMRDEGVIKFDCCWRPAPALSKEELAGLIEYRSRLHGKGLIGVYPDGIGFGNLSERGKNSDGFIISGTQTGHLSQADENHFALVTACDIERNLVECEGPIKASSESLTHAMIYEIFPEAKAVIHVHHPVSWERLQGRVPTSRREVPYGTPEMAEEVRRLARSGNLGREKLLVMAGHEEGILSFGADLKEAETVLMKHLLI